MAPQPSRTPRSARTDSALPVCPDRAAPDRAAPDRAAQNCAADHWAEDSLHYRAILRQIVDMGVEIAQQLHRQTLLQAQPEAADPIPAPIQAPIPAPIQAGAVTLSIAFDRIARAIRRTVALARHLGEPMPNIPAKPARTHLETRNRIIRGVEDVIREHVTGDMAENFRDDLYTRLDNPDFDDTIENRPIPDIVAEICRSLGIDIWSGPEPWKYTSDEELEALATRATRPRTKPARAGPTVEQ